MPCAASANGDLYAIPLLPRSIILPRKPGDPELTNCVARVHADSYHSEYIIPGEGLRDYGYNYPFAYATRMGAMINDPQYERGYYRAPRRGSVRRSSTRYPSMIVACIRQSPRDQRMR